MKILIAAALFVLCLIAAAVLTRHPHSPALADGDVVLLAEFSDDVLKQALVARLQQSRFLILGDDRIRETLRDMGRSSDERVTDSLAPQICRRAGVKALLGGSITSSGTHYVIDLYAVNCATGEILAREQREIDGKEHVLAKSEEAAAGILGRLHVDTRP